MYQPSIFPQNPKLSRLVAALSAGASVSHTPTPADVPIHRVSGWGLAAVLLRSDDVGRHPPLSF